MTYTAILAACITGEVVVSFVAVCVRSITHALSCTVFLLVLYISVFTLSLVLQCDGCVVGCVWAGLVAGL